MDPEIANKALQLAQEWGEEFMKPTQPRLAALYPKLTKKQLNDYDALAREAMRAAHGFTYDHPECEVHACEEAVLAKCPWVSGENIGRLYTQGMYYAHK